MAIKMDGHAITALKLKASNGSEVTKQLTEEGTIPTPTGSLSIIANGTYDVTNKASAIVNVPTSGDHNPIISVASSGLVTASCGGESTTHQLSATDDADFIAENIKQGVNIFGVLGTLTSGGANINWDDYHVGTIRTDVPHRMKVPYDTSKTPCGVLFMRKTSTGGAIKMAFGLCLGAMGNIAYHSRIVGWAENDPNNTDAGTISGSSTEIVDGYILFDRVSAVCSWSTTGDYDYIIFYKSES